MAQLARIVEQAVLETLTPEVLAATHETVGYYYDENLDLQYDPMRVIKPYLLEPSKAFNAKAVSNERARLTRSGVVPAQLPPPSPTTAAMQAKQDELDMAHRIISAALQPVVEPDRRALPKARKQAPSKHGGAVLA